MKKPKPPPGKHPSEDSRTPAQRFDDAMGALLSVSKQRIREIEEEDKKDKKKPNR